MRIVHASLPVFLTFVLGAVSPAGPQWARHTIDAGSRGADGVRLADFNRDGFPDIVTGWEEGGRIRVCLNPGPARAKAPWPALVVGEVGSPEDAVFADLDGDGTLEVVSASEGKVKTMWVHSRRAPGDLPTDKPLDTGAQAWQTQPLPASKGMQQWMFCLPLQLDGRNGIDLVAGGKGQDARIGWFQSPPDPNDLAAWTWRPLRPAGWVMSLLASDMDGDGDEDVVFSDRKGPARGCYWLENPGVGPEQSKPWREHVIGGQDREVMFLTLGDLDGDGRQDVIAATQGRELLFLRRTANRPPRWERFTIALPSGTGTGKGIAIGDIDRDGRPDLVFSCENAKGKSGVMWLSYRKQPTESDWLAHEISGPEGTKYDLVEILDLDADGDLDVLTCEETENLGVIWYENPENP